MDNLIIYEQGRAVPKEAQKEFSNGKFSGTDINPMWRIKKLTEIFGPAGIGWYTEVISERAEEHGNMTIAVVDINLYVNWCGQWSKPIFGTGGNVLVRKDSVSDEGYKMAYTDALSVACKALGIGADIYFASDKTKYSERYTAEKKTAEAPKQEEQKPESQKAPARKNAPPAIPAEEDAPMEPTREGPVPKCQNCGHAITATIGKDGSTIPASKVLGISQRKYQKAYCADCMKKLDAIKKEEEKSA